jgi:hypothetical protein
MAGQRQKSKSTLSKARGTKPTRTRLARRHVQVEEASVVNEVLLYVPNAQPSGTVGSAQIVDTPTSEPTTTINVREANSLLKYIEHEYIPYNDDFDALHELVRRLQKWTDQVGR